MSKQDTEMDNTEEYTEYTEVRDVDVTAPKEVELQVENITENPAEQGTEYYRSSRNLANQMLAGYKHDIKPNIPVQLSIWEKLGDDKKKTLLDLNVTKQAFYVGIDMEGDGWELMEVLQQLHHIHSQTQHRDRKDYYTGDLIMDENNLQLVPYAEEKDAQKIYIKTNSNEMAKLSSGRSHPTKHDKDSIMASVRKYGKKPFTAKYTEYYSAKKKCKGGKLEPYTSKRFVEQPIILFDYRYTANEGTGRDVLELWLSPIFYRQIANYFELKPIDFLQRVKNTYKDVKGTKKAVLPNYLLPFLTQLIDAQHYADRTYHCKLWGTDKEKGLYDKINYNLRKNRCYKRLDETLSDFIEVAKRIGLLEKHWTTPTENNEDTVYNFQVVEIGKWK